MKLKQLLKGVFIEQIIDYNPEIEIEYLCDNSKKNCKNSLFFALNGTNTNGLNYVHENQI